MKRIFVAFLFVGLCNAPLFAAADDNCANGDYDYINQIYALCSTHAYNIGLDKNPTAAQRDAMNTVIALKTTVITQQLYKQYEQMESMLNRFKTQLEKAVYKTDFEIAAGGGGSDDDSGDDGESTAVVKLDLQNCSRASSDSDAVDCYRDNLAEIDAAYNENKNKSTRAMRNALEEQMERMFKLKIGNKTCEKPNDNDCKDYMNIGNNKKFEACLNEAYNCVRTLSGLLPKQQNAIYLPLNGLAQGQ